MHSSAKRNTESLAKKRSMMSSCANNVESDTEIATRNALMNNWIAQLRERAKVKTYIDHIPETPEDSESESPSASDSSMD